MGGRKLLIGILWIALTIIGHFFIFPMDFLLNEDSIFFSLLVWAVISFLVVFFFVYVVFGGRRRQI